jgi:hypothetical protein
MREVSVSVPRYCWLMTPVLGFVMAATPAHEAVPDDGASDLERNRQFLRKWQADPEHDARLRRDLRAYWKMPRAKRERLRQLDQQLHQLDAKTQQRLWRVAERYREWLEKLPEDRRREIETAKDWQERLARIKEARQRQWIDKLPRRVRDDLMKLPEKERKARIVQLRQEELALRKLWQKPVRPGPPPPKPRTHLHDFPPEVREYAEKQLLPRLSAEEKRQYHDAEGRANFALTIKQLTDHHPVLPPLPAPNKPIVRYEDLPEKAKGIAGAKPMWERRVEAWRKLRQVEGIWPEWAETFVSFLTPEQRKIIPPLGASRPREFPSAVQTFIETNLRQAVKPIEFKRLKDWEGKWPEYPRRLLDLAHRHNLKVPGMSLPGTADLWEQPRQE